VEIPHSSSFDINNIITVAAWVKPTVFSDYSSIATTLGGNFYGWRFIYMSSKKLHFGMANISGEYQGVNSDDILTLNIWQHVAMTKSDTTVNFYKDGKNIGTKILPSAEIKVGSRSVRIGYESNNGSYLNGLVDDVRIYNRALSAGEIQYLYTKTQGRYK